MSDADALDFLYGIRGVGPWSAEYVLLRGLGRVNVFPGGDSGAQKGLQQFLKLEQRPDSEQTREILRRWRPFAGMIYFHLLLNKLREKGYL